MNTTERTSWRGVFPAERRRTLAGTSAMYQRTTTYRQARAREMRSGALTIALYLACLVLALILAAHP